MAKNRPQRNNNPLNIKVSSFTRKKYINTGLATVEPEGTFLRFNSLETGWQAARELLTGSTYRNLTTEEAMRRWSDGDYGAEAVPDFDSHTKIKGLTPEEISSLIDAMAKREGFYDEDKNGDKDGEDKDGEDKDGEDKDGEDKDGEDKDGEDKDGEDKDGEDGGDGGGSGSGSGG